MENNIVLNEAKIKEISLEIAHSALTTGDLDGFCQELGALLQRYQPVARCILAMASGTPYRLTHFYTATSDEADQSNYHWKEMQKSVASQLCITAIEQDNGIYLSGKQLQEVAEKYPNHLPFASELASWVALPLGESSGKAGALIIESDNSSPAFTEKVFNSLLLFKDILNSAFLQKLRKSELRANEKVSKAIFEISSAVNTSEDLDELYQSIHGILGTVIDTTNFRIALYDAKTDSAKFCYFVDTQDDENRSLKKVSSSGVLVAEVLLKGESLFFSKQEILERAQHLQQPISGSLCETWLAAPLKTKGQTIGAIVVQSYSDPNLYSVRDQDILKTVSEQVALAIDRKREEQRRKNSEKMTQALFEVTQTIHRADSLKDLYGAIHRSIALVMDVPNFYIALYEEENNLLTFTYCVDEQDDFLHETQHYLETKSLTAEVMNAGSLMMLEEEELRKREKQKSIAGTTPKIWLGVPLANKGKVIGVMATQKYSTTKPYSPREKDFFQSVSSQVAQEIQRQREDEALRRSENINKTLFEISDAVNFSTTLDELFQAIHQSLGNVLDVQNFYIALTDFTTDTIHFPYYIDEFDNFAKTHTQSRKTESLTNLVLQGAKAVLLDRDDLKKKAANNQIVGHCPLVWLGVPLKLRENVIGAMVVQSYSNSEQYSSEDIDLLLSVSDQVALAIDRKRAEKALAKGEEKLKNQSLQMEQFSLAAASIITMKDEKAIYQGIANAIVQYSDYKRVLISLFTVTPPYRLIIGHAGVSEDIVGRLSKVEMPRKWFESAFAGSIEIGQSSFYVPHSRKHLLREDGISFGAPEGEVATNLWHPEDNLFVKMVDQQGEFIGVISVDTSKSGMQPTAETVRPLEIFSSLFSQIIIYKKAQEELQKAKQRADQANTSLLQMNTRLEQTIAEAQELAEKAEEATRAKSEFLANMSHEIRTPMNAIIGFTELFKTTSMTEKQHDYVEVINQSSKSLLSIIDGVLDFSKIEAGKLTLEKKEFSVVELLDELIDMFTNIAEQKGLSLFFSSTQDVPSTIRGDQVRLRQVLINLIGNGIKFTSHGHIGVRVSAEPAANQSCNLIFSISDTGIGISEYQQEKLFDPFSQADSSTTREYGGTGLGLSICKSIVELMGGELWVKSSPGTGSTFGFNAIMGMQPGSSLLQKGVVDTTERLIFLAQADKQHRLFLKEILEHHDFTVLMAANAKETEKLLATRKEEVPCLLLTDEKIINTTGPKLQNTNIPTIVLSGHGNEKLPSSLADADLSFLLGKPVKQSLLLDTIWEIFNIESQRLQPNETEESMENLYTQLSVPLHGRRVLLVEDNSINRRVATEILENAGMQVETAVNGKEAVFIAPIEPFDVVLMDIQMPEMDGYQATGLIRRQEKASGRKPMCIIAMTAHAMEGDKEKCLAAGMNDYISKPINTKLLLTTLTRWMGPNIEENNTAVTTNPPVGMGFHPELDIDGIDTTGALERLGGNQKLLKELFIELRLKCTQTREFLDRADSQDDPTTLQHTVHGLKGVAGNLSAEALHEAAARYEKCLRNISTADGCQEEKRKLINELYRIEAATADLEKEGNGPQTDREPSPHLQQTFVKLCYMLRDADIECLEYLQDLGKLLPSNKMDAFNELEDVINAFDLERGEQLLSHLAASMDIELEQRK